MRKNYFLGILAIVVLISFAMEGCQSEPIVARVNDKPITQKDYDKQLNMMKGLLSGVDTSTDQGKSLWDSVQTELLNQMIDTELIKQTAGKKQITVSQDEINAKLASFKDEVGSADEYNQILKTNNLTEDELISLIRDQIIIEKVFSSVTDNISPTAEQVHAKQIVVSTKEAADDAMKKLKGGAQFDAVAKQVSEDTSTKDQGGDLGFFPRGVMEPEVENAAFNLDVGKMSDPIQTSWGYYIITVTEKDPNHDLSADYLEKSKEEAFQSWLDAARNSAKIEKFDRKS